MPRRQPAHRHAQRRPGAGHRAQRAGPRSPALRSRSCLPVRELFEGQVDASDIRDVTTADLLGRHEIDTDLEAIAGYLTGKRVLVTGAGGSIGSELCKQIYRFAPERLFMLDRDESALHAVQLAIEGRALLTSPDLVLCDLRDRQAVQEVFTRLRPDVVFHAAALKHLTLLEQNPRPRRSRPTCGPPSTCSRSRPRPASSGSSTSPPTRPPTRAACSATPSASPSASPATSRSNAPGTYLSVRFGNVLGSRGSMLTTFQSQIERGGPLTVTDPHVTRFFMTIEEAVQLVIQAGAIGRNGEALVLDMGKPVVIAEVARLMAARSDRRIAIEFTGLRPGEKLHEVLLAARRGRRAAGPPPDLPGAGTGPRAEPGPGPRPPRRQGAPGRRTGSAGRRQGGDEAQARHGLSSSD